MPRRPLQRRLHLHVPELADGEVEVGILDVALEVPRREEEDGAAGEYGEQTNEPASVARAAA